MNQKIERRKHPRVKGTYFLWYKHTNENKFSDSRLVVTENISAGGILFLTEEYLVPESRLNIQIMLPDLEDKVKIKARVIRSDMIGKLVNLYNTAVQFSQKPSRQFLNQISTLLEKQSPDVTSIMTP